MGRRRFGMLPSVGRVGAWVRSGRSSNGVAAGALPPQSIRAGGLFWAVTVFVVEAGVAGLEGDFAAGDPQMFYLGANVEDIAGC